MRALEILIMYEFFLPRWNKNSGDPQSLLVPILATVKKHLQGFEISSGGPGEKLCVDVVKISKRDIPDSFKICQTPGIQSITESFPNEIEKLQNQVIDELVFGLEQNDVAVTCLEKTVEVLQREREKEVGDEFFVQFAKTATNDEITTRFPPLPESLQNETEVVQLSDDESTMETPEQNDVAVTCLEKKVGVLEREREKEVGEEFFVEAAKTATNGEITTRLPPMPESLQNETEMVQLLDGDSTMETVRENELNVLIAEQNDVAVTSGEYAEKRHQGENTEQLPVH